MVPTGGRHARPGPATDPEAVWAGVDVGGSPGELVAVGGRLTAGFLLAAYRAGAFPWPDPARPLLLPWFSPDPRAVIPMARARLGRSLRAALRRSEWDATLDCAFDDVVAGCAARAQTWITAEMRDGYRELHAAGAAHSLEVWAGDTLVAGVYGVLTGGVFSAESTFHRAPGAGGAALAALLDRCARAGVVLLDTQQPSAHLARFGQLPLPRAAYLRTLHAVRDRPVRLPTGREPVRGLAGVALRPVR